MAHELLHSVRPLDKALSNILLCSVGYMHWTCSHLAHHRNVRPSCSLWDSTMHLRGKTHSLGLPHRAGQSSPWWRWAAAQT